jgi:hypothetical protein
VGYDADEGGRGGCWVLPGDLGLGRGDELGEDGWLRRETMRLQQEMLISVFN